MGSLLAIILIIGCIYLVYKFVKYQEEQEKIAEEREKRIERENATKKRIAHARNIYWSYLPNVYDGMDASILRQAYNLLQIMNANHVRIGDNHPETAAARTEIWGEAQSELKKLLNYPQWLNGDTDAYLSDQPIYYDLDMKYIYKLLNK